MSKVEKLAEAAQKVRLAKDLVAQAAGNMRQVDEIDQADSLGNLAVDLGEALTRIRDTRLLADIHAH